MVILMTAFGAVLIGIVQAVDATADVSPSGRKPDLAGKQQQLKIHRDKAAPP